MGVVLGVIVAVILWKLLKLSLMAFVWIAIIGAVMGALPHLFRRNKIKS